MKTARRNILFLILAIYLFFAAFSAYTLLPNCDEVWFTIPGYNLVEKGFFGTTVLDESANFRQVKLDGINHHTYWIMPVFPLVQATVGKIAGFGLMQTRAVSIFFGFAALLSWTFLIKKLSGNQVIALLGAGLMAVDYHFIYAASSGRMDMMTASLGIGALAFFVWKREKNLNYAILFSFLLTALAFFTHPLGLMWAVSLAILICLLDFKKLKIRHLGLAALPFILLGFGWFLYILQSPELFSRQFGGNASDRWGFLTAPLGEFRQEIELRYLANFGIGEGLNFSGRIKFIVLLSYIFSIIGILSIKSLRKNTISSLLLILAAQQFLMLLLLDGMKQPYYMIHITPTLTEIFAVWLGWLWAKKKVFKAIAAAILITVCLVGVSVDLLRLSRNPYHENYLAVGNLLNQNVKSTDLVIASSEFWFALEKKENLLDDYRLGFLTGKKADFIVIDAPRYKDWIDNLARLEPPTHQYIENLLQNDYEVIYEDRIYQLYKRKP